MLGYEPEALQENYSNWIQRMHPGDKERVESFYKNYLDGEKNNFRMEFRQKTKSNRWIWILSQGSIVQWDRSGNPLRLMGTHTDISERKKIEEELISAREALEKANKELEKLSNTDALTGIYNRRYFKEVLNKEWLRARRKTEFVSILMIDVDFFKLYNDHYGHMNGDECLRNVALSLNNSINRPPDLVARYGGEEFIVLLPDTNISGAIKVAENMRSALASRRMEHSDSSVNNFVTISIGIASIVPENEDGYSELIDHADKALYQAKKNGRNRIEFYKT